MQYDIDPEASAAPFEQVRNQTIAAVKDGRLVAGERMPTVRGLAEQLGLAANTVAKAYRALETDGVIETRGRAGSFVCATGDVTEREAKVAASAYADRIGTLGIDPADALAYVEAALRAR